MMKISGLTITQLDKGLAVLADASRGLKPEAYRRICKDILGVPTVEYVEVHRYNYSAPNEDCYMAVGVITDIGKVVRIWTEFKFCAQPAKRYDYNIEELESIIDEWALVDEAAIEMRRRVSHAWMTETVSFREWGTRPEHEREYYFARGEWPTKALEP